MGTFNSKSIFQFASKSDIIKIILAVTIVFVLLQFIRISMLITSNDDSAFYTYLWYKLSLPSTMDKFLTQPWTLFTYYFLDESFWGIVGNMIWLWIFGSVIEDLKGQNRIFPIFVIGSMAGGLLMILLSLLKPFPLHHFTGASAGVMAVAFAALLFKPAYKFWMLFGIGIPIWVFVLLFIGLRLASIQLNNLAYLFILLGGVIIGLGYNNVLNGFFEKCTHWLKQSATLFDNSNFILKKEPQIRNKAGKNASFKRIQLTPSKIDEILDKINEQGINSLSKEERQILDDYSKNKIEN